MSNLMTLSDHLATAKAEFKNDVKYLNADENKPSLSVRLNQVNNLIEDYVNTVGERPNNYDLYSLGSYLLDDYLTDQHKQHRRDEYPFKTDNRIRKNHARHQTVFLGDNENV